MEKDFEPEEPLQDAVLEVLRGAHDLLLDRANWAQGAYAFDSEGRNISPDDVGAVRWCSMGALGRMTLGGKASVDAYHAAAAALQRAVYEIQAGASLDWAEAPAWGVIDYNDRASTGHGDVMDMFGRAIKYVESDD